MEKTRIDLFDIHIFGVEEKLIDRFYFRDLIINLLKYDEFAKEVDLITGSKIVSKKTLEEKQKELNLIFHKGASGLIAMNLAIKFLSYLADKGLNEVLDDCWKEKMKIFKGF